MVYSDRGGRFTPIVLERCIPGAVPGIIFVCGLIVGELVSAQPMDFMATIGERQRDPRPKNHYDNRVALEET
jgi:hypothetical protein